MPYYVTCPNCGSNLDPGEVCDCGNEKRTEKETKAEKMTTLRVMTAHRSKTYHVLATEKKHA